MFCSLIRAHRIIYYMHYLIWSFNRISPNMSKKKILRILNENIIENFVICNLRPNIVQNIRIIYYYCLSWFVKVKSYFSDDSFEVKSKRKDRRKERKKEKNEHTYIRRLLVIGRVTLKRCKQICGWTFMKIPTALLALQMEREKNVLKKNIYIEYRGASFISSGHHRHAVSHHTLHTHFAFSIHAEESNDQRCGNFGRTHACSCMCIWCVKISAFQHSQAWMRPNWYVSGVLTTDTAVYVYMCVSRKTKKKKNGTYNMSGHFDERWKQTVYASYFVTEQMQSRSLGCSFCSLADSCFALFLSLFLPLPSRHTCTLIRWGCILHLGVFYFFVLGFAAENMIANGEVHSLSHIKIVQIKIL